MSQIDTLKTIITRDNPESLYYPVIKLSSQKNDWLLFEDLVRHTLCLGATGSGKTSSWGKVYLHHMMKAGCGGLVLTVKKDEAELVKKIAKETGREDDIIEFGLNTNHVFNFLEYTLLEAQKSGSVGYVNRLVNLFKTVISLQSGSNESTDNKDAFWIGAMETMLGSVIRMLIYSGETVSLQNIYDIVTTIPADIEDWKSYNEDGEIQTNTDSYFFNTYTKTKEIIQHIQTKTIKTQSDIRMLKQWKILSNYFEVRYIQTDIKTRATFIQMFIGMANKLLEDGISEVFASGITNITPEMTFEGKIIVLNIPYKEEEETARICQVIFKYCWQKAVEKRSATETDKFVFLYCDEAQYFVTRNDPMFLSTVRSDKACVCYMTQNISGLSRYLGFNQTSLQSFLANFQLFAFHQNADDETNKCATEMIGKTEIDKVTYSESQTSSASSQATTSKSKSTSKVWEFQIQKNEFSKLRGGGLNNDLTVEAVLFLNGRVWSDGKNYKRFVCEQG